MKKLVCAMLVGSLSLMPVCAFADEKDDRIAELEAKVAELESELAMYKSSSEQDAYKIGDTWTVAGQWNVTVESVEETDERNEYSDYDPEAVYILTYVYENIGYVDEDGIMDGLFISLDEGIVDSDGMMGYSYPGDQTYYADEVPVGAKCRAQVVIGVDHAGNFKINFDTYDGNSEKQRAVFDIEVE